MKKRLKQARQYEKTQTRKHRGRHQGGPGQPDYTRGHIKGEVKNWKRPVHKGVVEAAKKKGVQEIVSSSGFSAPAIEEAKKAGITLIYRGRRLT